MSKALCVAVLIVVIILLIWLASSAMMGAVLMMLGVASGEPKGIGLGLLVGLLTIGFSALAAYALIKGASATCYGDKKNE